MKSAVFPLAVCVMFLSGCNLFSKKENIQNLVSGTYVTEWTNEFTQGRDTIVIAEPVASESNIYQVAKRSFYRQTINGKLQKPQYKSQNWTGTYNPDVNTIVINKTGRILSLNPKKGILAEGTAIYNKLK